MKKKLWRMTTSTTTLISMRSRKRKLLRRKRKVVRRFECVGILTNSRDDTGSGHEGLPRPADQPGCKGLRGDVDANGSRSSARAVLPCLGQPYAGPVPGPDGDRLPERFVTLAVPADQFLTREGHSIESGEVFNLSGRDLPSDLVPLQANPLPDAHERNVVLADDDRG